MEIWKRNMIVLCIGNFMFFVGISMIVPFLPIYVQELGVSDVRHAALWASSIFAVNHLFLSIFSPVWGRVSDKYGKKKVLILCGAAMGCIVFAMGFVRSPLELFILRMFFGIMGGFSVAASSLTAVETPSEHRGKAMGVIQSGLVSGQLIGPLVGGVLAGTVGMRSAFYTTGLFMVAAVVLVSILIREPRTFSGSGRREPDTPGSPKPTWADAFRYPMVPVMFLTSFLLMGSVQSVDPILTLYVQSVLESDHIEFIGGMVFAASALGTILASPLIGRLVDRRGPKGIIIGALVLIAVVYVLLSMADSAWSLIGLRLLFGIGMGSIMPASSAFLSRLTPDRIQGSVFGYNLGLMSFGSVCGAMFGGLLANFSGFSWIFYSVAAVLVLHAGFLLLQFRRYEKKTVGKLRRFQERRFEFGKKTGKEGRVEDGENNRFH